jgi:hypothetical protein
MQVGVTFPGCISRQQQNESGQPRQELIAGLCISPIFGSRNVSEMQNRYRVRIGNAHIKSAHCWIANIIVSLVISSDLGDVQRSQHWRKCGHDQEPLTGILLIIITIKMTGKISFMPDGKY